MERASTPDRADAGSTAAAPVPAGPPAELLARAFHAAPNGFVLVGLDGRIVAANSELEKMFGHAPNTLAGQPLDNLLPSALREAHRDLREGYFKNPEPRAMGAGRVLYASRSDGHEFPVEIGLYPLHTPEGPLVRA